MSIRIARYAGGRYLSGEHAMVRTFELQNGSHATAWLLCDHGKCTETAVVRFRDGAVRCGSHELQHTEAVSRRWAKQLRRELEKSGARVAPQRLIAPEPKPEPVSDVSWMHGMALRNGGQ